MWEYNSYPSSNELYHHGVIGMHWGIRRYQNKDGSLTSAGKQHYTKHPNSLNRKLKKQIRQERKRQYGSGNQWIQTNDIGPKSKKAVEKQLRDQERITKAAEKDIDRIEKKYQNDPDRMQDEIDKLYVEKYKQPLADTGAMIIVGEPYTKKAIKRMGNVNVGYLEDLGYSKDVAKELNDIVLRSKRVMIY